MHTVIFGCGTLFPKPSGEPLLGCARSFSRALAIFARGMSYDDRMLAQIVVHTNAHPYHIQVISFWLSLAPVVVIIALLLFVQYWRIRRNRKKSRRSVR